MTRGRIDSNRENMVGDMASPPPRLEIAIWDRRLPTRSGPWGRVKAVVSSSVFLRFLASHGSGTQPLTPAAPVPSGIQPLAIIIELIIRLVV